jgi:hypothetical protein
MESISLKLPVVVTSVNSRPTVAAPHSIQYALQDVDLRITNVSVSDPDLGGSDIYVSISADSGAELVLADTTDVILTQGGLFNQTVAFHGPIEAVNTALASMIYRRPPVGSKIDVLHVTAHDGGSSGSGGVMTHTAKIVVEMIAMDELPKLLQSDNLSFEAEEDSFVTISGVSLSVNASSVSQSKAIMHLQCDVLHGSLFFDLPQPGISVALSRHSIGTGSTNTGRRLSIWGTLGHLNDALNAGFLKYKGELNWAGTDRIAFNISHQNSMEIASSSYPVLPHDQSSAAITVNQVNDPPAFVQALSEFQTSEDVLTVLPPTVLNDTDLDGKVLRVSVSAEHGSLTVQQREGTKLLSNRTSSAVTFEGVQDEVNLALANLSYRSTLHYNGWDTIRFLADDGDLKSEHQLLLGIAAINDAPALFISEKIFTAYEGQDTAIRGIYGTDVDVKEAHGGMVQVTLRANHGSVALLDWVGLQVVEDAVYPNPMSETSAV